MKRVIVSILIFGSVQALFSQNNSISLGFGFNGIRSDYSQIFDNGNFQKRTVGKTLAIAYERKLFNRFSLESSFTLKSKLKERIYDPSGDPKEQQAYLSYPQRIYDLTLSAQYDLLNVEFDNTNMQFYGQFGIWFYYHRLSDELENDISTTNNIDEWTIEGIKFLLNYGLGYKLVLPNDFIAGFKAVSCILPGDRLEGFEPDPTRIENPNDDKPDFIIDLQFSVGYRF
jgi:hypothetical protein